jgi:hypothetical protein
MTTDRDALRRDLLDQLRRIEGPSADYTPWWAMVRDANRLLIADRQQPLGLAELSQ